MTRSSVTPQTSSPASRFGLSGGIFRRGQNRKVQRNLDQLIHHVRQLSLSLRNCSADQLQTETASVQAALLSGRTLTQPEVLVSATALATEALRRAHQVELYDVQLLAAMQLAFGRIVQMLTGEGKTFVAIAGAAMLAFHGRGVHVMTPNIYLAERDHQAAAEALQHLGLSVGLTPEQGEPAAKKQAYDCDVTYGTGHEFGFDYLRDQLTLRAAGTEPLGQRILQQLQGEVAVGRTTMQRGLRYAIVDEADSVMLDDAVSPLVLSQAAPGEAPDAIVHRRALKLASRLQPKQHFVLNETTGLLRLTEVGRNLCYSDDVEIPSTALLRPWTAYVEQALRAGRLFRKDVHYVVREQEVRIVDQTTGRIFEDRSWQDGLHQAIEAREGVPITPEKSALARISRQRFFRLYDNLCGMTGTALGCEKEFQQVYRCPIVDVPLHRPGRRVVHEPRYFASRDSKLRAVAADAIRRHQAGQPVLVGTQSIADSESLVQLLRPQIPGLQVLNGLQDSAEADIISQAGQPSAVMIATNLAGRGTDIHVPDSALACGGLHVIVVECQLSGRMDRQLIGRSARQGQPGSAQVFVSAEDYLLSRFGPWLSAAIRRESDEHGEAHADFRKPLLRLQQAAEKQQFLTRVQLLRSDSQHDQFWQK